MTEAWLQHDLSSIARADDLHVSPFREDGETYGTPTWIWSVVVDGQLYARAYNGVRSQWYQAARSQKAGRISVAGKKFEVCFEPASDEIADEIDSAYRGKYAGNQYLAPMIGTRAKAATVRIFPIAKE